MTEENRSESIGIGDLGKVTGTEEVIKGHTVTMQTLSVVDQDAVYRGLGPDTNAYDRFHLLQRLTLTYATTHYNGKKVVESVEHSSLDVSKIVERSFIEHFYSTMQDALLSDFYRFYLTLVEKQTKVIEELKKK